MSKRTVEKAAKEIFQIINGSNLKIIGTSIVSGNLYVDISGIPTEFKGHKIHVRIVGEPVFAEKS
jgi:hypothetical protein